MVKVDTIKEKKPKVFAVSGIKNSGKTTLVEQLVTRLTQLGYKVGVIKHDGHEFVADHEGTDSYRHKAAGAKNVIVYSKTKMMMVQEHEEPSIEKMIAYQKDMDIVILEGMKYSTFPKIEVVRGARSKESVCDPKTLLAIVTDVPLETSVPLIGLNDIEGVLEIIKEKILSPLN